MQIGSLVECIKTVTWENYKTKERLTHGPVKGDIGKVVDMGRAGGIDWIELAEHPPRPDGKKYKWEAKHFVEIQPPMEVDISKLLEEPALI